MSEPFEYKFSDILLRPIIVKLYHRSMTNKDAIVSIDYLNDFFRAISTKFRAAEIGDNINSVYEDLRDEFIKKVIENDPQGIDDCYAFYEETIINLWVNYLRKTKGKVTFSLGRKDLKNPVGFFYQLLEQ